MDKKTKLIVEKNSNFQLAQFSTGKNLYTNFNFLKPNILPVAKL